MQQKIKINRYRSHYICLQSYYPYSSATCKFVIYLLNRHLNHSMRLRTHLHNIQPFIYSAITVFLQKLLLEREHPFPFITSQYQSLSLPLDTFVTFLGRANSLRLLLEASELWASELCIVWVPLPCPHSGC